MEPILFQAEIFFRREQTRRGLRSIPWVIAIHGEFRSIMKQVTFIGVKLDLMLQKIPSSVREVLTSSTKRRNLDFSVGLTSSATTKLTACLTMPRIVLAKNSMLITR